MERGMRKPAGVSRRALGSEQDGAFEIGDEDVDPLSFNLGNIVSALDALQLRELLLVGVDKFPGQGLNDFPVADNIVVADVTLTGVDANGEDVTRGDFKQGNLPVSMREPTAGGVVEQINGLPGRRQDDASAIVPAVGTAGGKDEVARLATRLNYLPPVLAGVGLINGKGEVGTVSFDETADFVARSFQVEAPRAALELAHDGAAEVAVWGASGLNGDAEIGV